MLFRSLAAILLLIAIVAAISLTMRKRTGLKQQNIARQIAARAKDRVRIVKVAPVRPDAPASEPSSKGNGP